jgi:hypothetical protein
MKSHTAFAFTPTNAVLCLGLFMTLTSVSCLGPKNTFHNQPNDAPHAVLRGSDHVFAFNINGQPTSFWRSSETFRIAPGTNTVSPALVSRKENLGYKTLEFVAVAGGEYVLARKREPEVVPPFAAKRHPAKSDAWIIFDQRDRVVVQHRQAGGPAPVIVETPKEGYVFGVSSADEAIAEYGRENP